MKSTCSALALTLLLAYSALACTTEEEAPVAKKKAVEQDTTTTEDPPPEDPAPVEDPAPEPVVEAPPADPVPQLPPPPPPSPVPPPNGGSLQADAIATLKTSYDQCVSQGKAWVAVTGAGGDPSCGGAIAPFCCTKDTILKRFLGSNVAIGDRIKVFAEDGKMTLYHCSVDGDGRTRLHFGRFDGSITYRSTYTLEVAAAGAYDDPACVAPTFESIQQQ